jgi:hypothetical protein
MRHCQVTAVELGPTHKVVCVGLGNIYLSNLHSYCLKYKDMTFATLGASVGDTNICPKHANHHRKFTYQFPKHHMNLAL